MAKCANFFLLKRKHGKKLHTIARLLFHVIVGRILRQFFLLRFSTRYYQKLLHHQDHGYDMPKKKKNGMKNHQKCNRRHFNSFEVSKKRESEKLHKRTSAGSSYTEAHFFSICFIIIIHRFIIINSKKRIFT
jgi:hypothetical protein